MSLFMWLERSKFPKDGFEIAFLFVSEAYFISCADQNIKNVTIYYVWLTDIVFAGGKAKYERKKVSTLAAGSWISFKHLHLNC